MIKQIEYTKQIADKAIEYVFIFDGDKLTDEQAMRCVQTDEYTPYGFAIYSEHRIIITQLIRAILHDKESVLVDRKSLEVYMKYALCKCQTCDDSYVCGDTIKCADNKCELYTAEEKLEKALAQQ